MLWCSRGVAERARFGFAERPFRQNGPTWTAAASTSCLPRPERRGSQQIAKKMQKGAGLNALSVVMFRFRCDIRDRQKDQDLTLSAA
jgi:ribosomal protein L4